MAIRTDDDAVKDVLQGDYDTDAAPSLASRIKAASLVVDRVVACALAKGTPLTSGEAEVLETWLAAHMYCMSDQQYQSRSTGGGSGSFKGQGGMRLEQTTYGQTCLMLDPSGCLNAQNAQNSADMLWLGKNPSSQIDYEDRA